MEKNGARHYYILINIVNVDIPKFGYPIAFGCLIN